MKLILFFILFGFINSSIIKLLHNQDRSIDTNQYDCIVKFSTAEWTCTGTFISENILITAQHCISLNETYVTINGNTLYEYEITTNDEDIYDVAIIKFIYYKHKCYSYFKITDRPNTSLTKFRRCGHGKNNESKGSTDEDFGCRDYEDVVYYSDGYYHYSCSKYPENGDSGSPLFTTVNNTNHIYSIFYASSRNISLCYCHEINQSYVDWCISSNSTCLTKISRFNLIFYYSLSAFLFLIALILVTVLIVNRDDLQPKSTTPNV